MSILCEVLGYSENMLCLSPYWNEIYWLLGHSSRPKKIHIFQNSKHSGINSGTNSQNYLFCLHKTLTLPKHFKYGPKAHFAFKEHNLHTNIWALQITLIHKDKKKYKIPHSSLCEAMLVTVANDCITCQCHLKSNLPSCKK